MPCVSLQMRADSSSEPGRMRRLLHSATMRVRALSALCLAAVLPVSPAAAHAQSLAPALLHLRTSTQTALLPALETLAAGELLIGELLTGELLTGELPADALLAGAMPADTGSSWNYEPCLGGLNYGAPYKLAISYGGGFVRESDADICVPVIGRIGLGAMGVSTGIALSSGPFGSGLAVTAGVLRSFNSPLDALPNRNHAGVSLHLWPLLGLGGEIGLYQRLGKDTEPASRSRKLLVWSAGFGF